MEPSSIGSAVNDFGWLIVIVWFAVDKLWPWLSQAVFPQRAAERQAEVRRVHDFEDRQIAAYEQIARAVSEITVSNAMINERMAQFNVALMEYAKSAMEHHRMTENSINRMMERTALAAKRKSAGRGEG